MKRFPLPTDTFPELELSREDERRLEDVAEAIVQKTIAQYHSHLTEDKGVVDEKRWKKIKTRGELTAYRERQVALDDITDEQSEASAALSPSPVMDEANALNNNSGVCTKRLTSMLAFGFMPGKLDDVMYGMLNTTTEEMQLKSAYIEDGFVDWKLLATIFQPNEQDPYRDLSLKWSVKGHPLLLGAVMRARDSVLIESTGIAFTPSGERVGYHLFHSVVVDGMRELEAEFEILRIDLTVCEFFRQRDPKNVEVYGRALSAPTGDVPASLMAFTSAEVALSVFKHTHCAEMKKLARIVGSLAQSGLRSATETFLLSSSSNSRPPGDQQSQSTMCSLCTKSLKSARLPFSSTSLKEKSCFICCERICSRCRVHKTIYQPSPTEFKKLIAVDMVFCTRCIHLAVNADSQTFAVLDVHAAQGKRVDYGSLRGLAAAQD